jgi:hypothetical protein
MLIPHAYDPWSIYESEGDLRLDGEIPLHVRRLPSSGTTRFVNHARANLGHTKEPGQFISECLTASGRPVSLFPSDHTAEQIARFYARSSVLFKLEDQFRPDVGDLVFLGISGPWSAESVGIVEAVTKHSIVAIASDLCADITREAWDYPVPRGRVQPGELRVIGFARPNLGGAYVPVGDRLDEVGLATRLAYHLLQDGYLSTAIPTDPFSVELDAAIHRLADDQWIPKATSRFTWALDYYGIQKLTTPLPELGFLEVARYWWRDNVRRPVVDISDFAEYGVRGSESVRHLQRRLNDVRGTDLRVSGHLYFDTERALSRLLRDYRDEGLLKFYRKTLFPVRSYRLVDGKDTK